MSDFNIVVAHFGHHNRVVMTDTLYQYDYGQQLKIEGITALPQTFQAHFSNVQHGGVSITVTGINGVVDVPNSLLMTGKRIYCWIYVTETGSGETVYQILMPVQSRPMPEYYDVEDVGVFDSVVNQVAGYAATATTGATSATASATAAVGSEAAAAASASAAADSAENAAASEANAEASASAAQASDASAATAATTATAKAAEAAQSATSAGSAADRAEAAQEAAETAQEAAETAATSATTDAATASTKATAAAASATTASTKATDATNAATTATAQAVAAEAAKTTAVEAKTAAQSAQSAAETAATTATAKATEAAASATAAAQAAASINTPDSALSDTSTNAVQNKVITAEITDVKTAIDEIDDTLIMSPDKNLIDVSTLISGYELTNQQGTIRKKTGWYVTDWIEIEPNTTYTLSGTSSTYRAEVDSTKTTYTGSNHNTATFTTGANSKYVRFNSLISGYATPQLEKGSVATTYAPYKLTSARLKRIESEMFVPDGTPDSSELVSGAYVSASTGAVISDANYSYVKAYVYPGVKATYSYYGNSVTGIAFYDIGENCLASYDALRTTPIVLTVPDGAYIVKATVTSVDQITFDRDLTDMKAIAVDALGGVASQMFILPTMSVAVIGHEWNLYYDNVYRGDVGICDIITTCSPSLSGFKALEDCIRVTPGEGQDGAYTVTLTAKLKATGATLDTQSFTLYVIEDDYASLSGKKVIFIGDSLTNAGIYPAEIEHNLSHGNLVSLGTLSRTVTLDETSITVYHEGRSGWSANDYITKANDSNFTNAFWNPGTNAFDFSYYMTEQGYTGVDVVCINLGTNGYNTSVNAINTMIESILDYDSNIIILISLVAPPATQDGCGNYNVGSLQNAFDLKRSFLRLDKQYMDAFQDNASLPNVFVSAVYFNLDRRHDYPTVEQPLSSRNPTMVTRQNNNVHPSTYGYLKFADVYYNNLLYHLGI